MPGERRPEEYLSVPFRRAVLQYERAPQLKNVEHLEEPQLGGRLASFKSHARSVRLTVACAGGASWSSARAIKAMSPSTMWQSAEWEMASRGANPPRKS